MKFVNLFLPAFACSATAAAAGTPPLASCSTCRFALKSTPYLSNDYLKCMLFPKHMDDDAALATWKFHLRTSNHYFCQTARSHPDMCGTEGSLYEPQKDPKQKGGNQESGKNENN